MAKSSNQKMKILFLLTLFKEAGENTVYSMQNIVDMLAEQGIRAERKSIYDDLEVLRQYGMDIRFRKERPSGYFLAGTGNSFTAAEDFFSGKVQSRKEEESLSEPEVKIVEKIVEKIVVPDPVVEIKVKIPDWLTEYNGIKREIKLQCSQKGKEAALEYLGEAATAKEKFYGVYMVSGQTVIGPAFYGWLTAMAKDVRLVKPKKEAASYREYIKEISREYKGIIQ